MVRTSSSSTSGKTNEEFIWLVERFLACKNVDATDLDTLKLNDKNFSKKNF